MRALALGRGVAGKREAGAPVFTMHGDGMVRACRANGGAPDFTAFVVANDGARSDGAEGEIELHGGAVAGPRFKGDGALSAAPRPAVAPVFLAAGPALAGARDTRCPGRAEGGELAGIGRHIAEAHEAGEHGEVADEQPSERRAGTVDEDVKGEREGQEHTQRGTGKILPDGGAEKEEEDRVSNADTPPPVVETPAGGEEYRLRGEAERREPRGEGEAVVRDGEQGGRGGGPFFDETGAGESEVGPAGIGGPDAPAEVNEPGGERKSHEEGTHDIAEGKQRVLGEAGEGEECGLAGEGGSGEEGGGGVLPRPFGGEEGGRENREGDEVGEGEAHAGECPGGKEYPGPREQAAGVGDGEEFPEEDGEGEPRDEVEKWIRVDDPSGLAGTEEPCEGGREDAAGAVAKVVHRTRECGVAQRRVVGDLRVVESVVAAVVAVHENGQLAEGGDLQLVVGRVELDERREAVNGVPEASDQT